VHALAVSGDCGQSDHGSTRRGSPDVAATTSDLLVLGLLGTHIQQTTEQAPDPHGAWSMPLQWRRRSGAARAVPAPGDRLNRLNCCDPLTVAGDGTR
jgi:hypothetical protein